MPNPLKADPTRTTTLRHAFVVEMRRRFRRLRDRVWEVIVELDVLGLEEPQPLTLRLNALLPRQAFRFTTDDKKLEEFNKWFKGQVDQDILQVSATGEPWTAKYVDSAYKKGAFRAYADVHKEALAEKQDVYVGTREQFLQSAFNQPERLSKIRMLATRSFEELKGVSAAMGQQMNRILADGLSQGIGPRELGRRMDKAIDGLTRTRAVTIARTEIIQAHAEGQLDSFEDLGVQEVGVMAEWSTAGDDRVCDMCVELEGEVMTVEEARGLIPRHPNCRCAWIPANVGETPHKVKGTEKAVKDSLKAELPNRTREGERVPQTVKEAAARSTWAGKELIGR